MQEPTWANTDASSARRLPLWLLLLLPVGLGGILLFRPDVLPALHLPIRKVAAATMPSPEPTTLVLVWEAWPTDVPTATPQPPPTATPILPIASPTSVIAAVCHSRAQYWVYSTYREEAQFHSGFMQQGDEVALLRDVPHSSVKGDWVKAVIRRGADGQTVGWIHQSNVTCN